MLQHEDAGFGGNVEVAALSAAVRRVVLPDMNDKKKPPRYMKPSASMNPVIDDK